MGQAGRLGSSRLCCAHAASLASVQVGVLYYQAFIRTMRREWMGIDHLRLDKFMMLLRKFLAQLLRVLQGNAWCGHLKAAPSAA